MTSSLYVQALKCFKKSRLSWGQLGCSLLFRMHNLSYSVTGTCLTGLSINPSHKCPFIQTYGSNWFLILFSVEMSFSLVLDQYTWYKHHACHAGKHDHDGWLWITVRPVPKRAFAFRFIESLGQKIMVVRWTSLLKSLACLTKKIGCHRPSEHQLFMA